MEQVSHIHSGFYLCPEDFSISQLCETFRDGASAPAEMQARHVSDAPGWYPLFLTMTGGGDNWGNQGRPSLHVDRIP